MDLASVIKGRAKAPILAALIVLLVCLSLSAWQWQRAQKKHLINAEITQQKTALSSSKQASVLDSHNTQITIQGEFIAGHVWFLDNQVVKGKVGFDVIALFRAQHTGEQFIVNLGFVPQKSSRTPPTFLPPKGVQTLSAYIKPKGSKSFTLADSAAQGSDGQNIIQYIDVEYLAQQSDIRLVPVIAYLNTPLGDTTEPHYQPVVMSPQKHEAYALQWLLIGLAAAVIGWKLSKKEYNNV